MHFWDAALYASGQVMQKNVQRVMHATGHDLQSMLAGVLKKEADCSDGADGADEDKD